LNKSKAKIFNNEFIFEKGNKMVVKTKIVEECFSHFFKYEKNYNETLKDV